MAAPDRHELVRLRRTTVFQSFFGAIFFYALLHFAAGSLTEPLNSKPHSFLFGSMETWPEFVKSFWLFDFLSIWFYLSTFMYIIFRTMAQRSYERSEKLIAVLRGTLGAGGLGGLFNTLFNGWYGGIEGFVLGIPALSALAGAWFGLFFGAGYALIGLGKLIAMGWAKIAHTRLTRPLQRIGDYLDAKDVPSDTSAIK